MNALRKYRLLLGIVIVVFLLDWWTKALIRKHFVYGERRDIVSPVFALTHVRNHGAAFSFMDDAPPAFRDRFFVVIPLVALIGIFLYYRKIASTQKLTAVCLSLIAGGAIGNLVDRLRFGYVTDFLDFHWKEIYHYPRFNVADSCIVVGVALLFIQSMREQPAPEPKSKETTTVG